MPSFSVNPDDVSDAGRSLAGLGDQLRDGLAKLMVHSDAGSGTPGADSVSGLFTHFGAVMPHYAEAHDAFSRATVEAGVVYSDADQGVGGAANELDAELPPA